MRTKTVSLSGKEIVIREQLIKQLKNDTLSKIEPAWEALKVTDMSGVIGALGDQIKVIFPEIKGVDLDECYPSEVEAFLEAWIEVNFTGLKRLLGPLLSLVKVGLQQQGLDSENPLASLITGKN